MGEIYSDAEDCYYLAKKLKAQLGNKISFYGSINTPIPSGVYLSQYRRNNHEGISYNPNCLPFYFKYAKNQFLRIGVGSTSKNNSLGEKLAALSDFYEILSNEFGEPTVFYTTKDDDESLLSFQWSFVHKDEDISKFQNGSYFDDAEIDKLIIIGQNKETSDGFRLQDKTRMVISRQIGLPFDLLYMVDEDIENYIKHKNGNELSIPESAKIDGCRVTSLKMKKGN